jgi:hypothetical protein
MFPRCRAAGGIAPAADWLRRLAPGAAAPAACTAARAGRDGQPFAGRWQITPYQPSPR